MEGEEGASDDRVDGKGVDMSQSKRNESSGNIAMLDFLCEDASSELVLLICPIRV